MIGTAVPVYIEARNPDLYYQFDEKSASLRRTLYFWVLLQKQNTSITVRIGKPILKEELEQLGPDEKAQTEAIKQRVLGLHRPSQVGQRK